MSGPLEGIRVIDVSRFGRMATDLLADYGADVISVIQPGGRDRYLGGMPGVHDEHTAVSRNRRSVFLNLRDDGDREVFYRLIKSSHALLESFRPGAAQKLGIDYESLRKVNPGIVYCSLSGYGQEGPYRNLAGHDLNFQALGGHLPQDEKGKPVIPPYNDADTNAGWNGTMAILMGLLSRSRTGKGQYVAVSFVDGVLRIPPGRLSASGSADVGEVKGIYPGYNIYECQDGKYISLGNVERFFWERVCKAIGRDDLLPYQRPEEPKRQEVLDTFRRIFKSKARDEWFRILREHDVHVAPVHLTTEELVNDPHHRERGSILEMKKAVTGETIYERGFAVRFAETPATLKWGPSAEGSHTREILKELGYSEAEIAAKAPTQ